MRYYNMAGDYGSEEINLVYIYYQIPYVPYTIFDGLEEIGGGGEEIASGEPFLQTVEGKYFEPSPIKLEIDNFNKVEGTISVTATMFADSVSDATIRFILIEDDVYDIYTHVTRDIIKDDFDLSGNGNTITFEKSFLMSHDWNTDNLHAVVFVQMPDKKIIQATSTYPIPSYKVRALVPFATNYYDSDFIPDSNYIFESDSLAIINFGLEDNLNMNLIIDEIPEDWNISFSDSANTYENSVSFALAENGYKQFKLNIAASSYGSADFHFEITSENADYLYSIPFSYTNYETQIQNTEISSKNILYQNYPNPFNPNLSEYTTISFDLTSNSNRHQKIEIFNIKGELIRSILTPENGKNFVLWDGVDMNGRKVSAGIYFYRLTENSQNNMRKMVLIK